MLDETVSITVVLK